MRSCYLWLVVVCFDASLSHADDPAIRSPIRFDDVTASTGLIEPLAGIMGHGGAWGDVNGDGKPDLFVGGFCDRPNREYSPASGPVPCRLLINDGNGKFRVAEKSETEVFGRTSGAVFADLDNNGTLELFAANNARAALDKRRDEPQRSAQVRASQLFRNDGGTLIDITRESGACPDSLLSARNIGVWDFDGDGRLDLFVVEDIFVGKGRQPRSALLRNLGDLKFADVTKEVGLPEDIHGLGLAVADLNNDGRPDLFVGHSNRMFLSQPGNTFRETTELSELFRWKPLNKEDWPCGAAFGDLNRDGRLDLVIGIHHAKARNRVYLNDGLKDGVPQFRDITEAAGLGEEVPVKCPHVEIQDFDNDGWPDIFFSAGWLKGDQFTPLIYRHVGVKDGVPRFEPPRAIEGPMVYFPAAPTADFDRDGKLDVFCINWFADNRSRLLRNVGGDAKSHWLQVAAHGTTSNRQGIGSRVRVFRDGQHGNEKALLGQQEISIGFGYASGQEAISHFGLGGESRVDLEVIFPSGERVTQTKLKADQFVSVAEPSANAAKITNPKRERGRALQEARKRSESQSSEVPALANASGYLEKPKKAESKKSATKPKTPSPESLLEFPPKLPNNADLVTDSSPDFLKPVGELLDGVTIAKTPPTIDWAYFPGQDYLGKPWSNWGDSSFANGKYYTAIGDHLAPRGNAFVFEYNPATKQFKKLLDLSKLLSLPEGHYSPGKIHSRVDLGSDGWLYCSTHRGSPSATTDANHYLGDWIVRCHPETGASEIVAHGPLGKACIPNGTLDPQRLIFYGGTAPGQASDSAGVQFFAFDVRNRKLLYSGGDGPQRYLIVTNSGRAYYTPAMETSPLMRFDPASGKPPEKIPGEIGIRAATRETIDGSVYTLSKESPPRLFRFNTRDESITDLGLASVGVNSYVAAMTTDPVGRYVYYAPGAHGGSESDGSAIVQFDTKNRQRKVIAFLHPFYQAKYGVIPKGTYGLAVSTDGATLFVTWNVSRGSRAWDCCALTAIHIPADERKTN